MKRRIGIVLVVLSLFVLVPLVGWQLFLAWVYLQDMGRDQEAIAFYLQPATCITGWCPISVMGIVALVLVALPSGQNDR